MNPHPYHADELAAGRSQADAFLARLAGGPVECDALAQQVEIARMGSIVRLRGFAARIQQEFSGGADRGTD